MKKALSFSLLAIVAVFSLACDNGELFGYPEYTKVVVEVEREIYLVDNRSLKVLAADFYWKSDDSGSYILTFTCPCHLGPNKVDDFTSVIEVLNQEVVTVKLLPGAAYNVYERRLDNGEERSYHFPMETTQE